MPKKGTVQAAIYCRISRDAEGSGLGIQRQEEDCRALAATLGWGVSRTYVDNDISAYSGKRRPEYERLLADMGNGAVQGVIAWHTDRLHRSPRELEAYIDTSEKRGIITHTVKAGEIDLSTPSGRAVARTLGAWARYESEHKSERIIRKKLQLAQDGAFGGGPVPFGWRLEDGKPVIVEADAAEIRRAVQGFLAGKSIGHGVRDFNSRGVLTRRGQQWTSTAYRNLLKRPTNAGLSVYRGEVMGASVFPAIITEEQWRAATSALRNPSRLTQNGSKVRHLMAGMLRCGTCGGAMRTSSRNGDSGQVYYYKCPTLGGGHTFQNAAPLEQYVSGIAVGVLSRPRELRSMNAQTPIDSGDGLREQSLTLQARLNEAAHSFADGSITAAQLGIITERITSDLEVVRAQLAALQSVDVLAGRYGSPEAVQEWWDASGIEDRRAVIDALMTVYVKPVRKAAPRKFDPDRIRIEWKAPPSNNADAPEDVRHHDSETGNETSDPIGRDGQGYSLVSTLRVAANDRIEDQAS